MSALKEGTGQGIGQMGGGAEHLKISPRAQSAKDQRRACRDGGVHNTSLASFLWSGV